MSHRASQQTDDWSQVTDRTERRRIQNLIAQREYRKRLKRKLKEAESIIASESNLKNNHQSMKPHAPPGPSFTKDYVKTKTRDLHQNQFRQPQDYNVASVQQQCKEWPSNVLLPAAHPLVPTSDEVVAGYAAQNIKPSFTPSYPSTTVTVGWTTLLPQCPAPNIFSDNNSGSPFDEGYLAMYGP